MMHDMRKIQLHWNGRTSVHQITSLLEQTDQIAIQLAPGYNHALYSRLHSSSARAGNEDIDRTGGAELLEVIAGIQGLEAFAELVEPLSQAGVSVHIESPARVSIELSD